jgi:hypothetical protein
LPVSTYSRRLSRNVAHFMLQCDMNSAASPQLRCPNSTIVFYSLTEKGLDLIPVILEIVLWSAKHDPQSEARRIPRLVELIRADNRAISREVRARVRRGEGIVAYYLEASDQTPARP